jgi:hypothetical protein
LFSRFNPSQTVKKRMEKKQNINTTTTTHKKQIQGETAHFPAGVPGVLLLRRPSSRAGDKQIQLGPPAHLHRRRLCLCELYLLHRSVLQTTPERLLLLVFVGRVRAYPGPYGFFGMYIYVHVYLYMYLYMYVCVYIYIYLYIYICMCICMYVCMYVCIYI